MEGSRTERESSRLKMSIRLHRTMREAVAKHKEKQSGGGGGARVRVDGEGEKESAGKSGSRGEIVGF